jgi:hypothetical protein
MVHAYGIEDIVTFEGPKSYPETLSYIKGANLLLLIGSDRKNAIPVKLFDYVACKKPILALGAGDEPFFEITDNIPFVKVVRSGNPEEIAEVIKGIYEKPDFDFENFKLPRQFERKYLTEKLSQVLNDAVK